MNSLARLVVLTAAVFWAVRASAQVAEAWAREVQLGFPLTLDVQPSGQLQIFGWGGSSDSGTARLDPNGAVLWNQRFDSNSSTLNVPIDQVVDGFGNVYVVCNDNGLAPSTSQIALLKYANDGGPLWTTFFPGIEVGSTWASQLALDSQGHVILAATILTNDQSDFFTLKFDGNGSLLWSARYDGGRNEVEPVVAVDAAGSIHIAGRIFDPRTGISDMVILKYNSSGQQLWVAHYDSPARRNEYPVAIRIDAAGNVYVAGHADTDLAHGYSLQLEVLKFSPGGQLLWTAHYSRATAELLFATDVALDGSGNLLVVGQAYNYGYTSGDTLLVKFDPSGNRLWAARYNGPSNGTETARGLAVDLAGNAYVTGDSQDGPDRSSPEATTYFTQKFDPSGNRLWNISRRNEAGAYNYPADIGLDAAGGVYIAGQTNGNWLAVKYVQTPAPGLPSILSPPTRQTVLPRETAIFSVAATGNPPLSYQWRYNGLVIDGATDATLTLDNVQFAEHGGYSVDVSNAVGLVATAEAELVVLEPPTITRQPVSQTAFVGTEAAFIVAAEGLPPFTYQWRRDGCNLPGATNATFTLFNLQPADAGAYSVVIGNIASSITSQVAVLTVSTQVMRSWSARYDPIGGYALSPLLALDGAGLPVFTVTSQGAAQDFDFATFKFNLGGTQLWASGFNSASNHADYATALFIDAVGSAYVAGHSLGGEQPALSVVKYNAAGQLLWSMATNHPWRTEAPCVISADNAGNAYVAASDQYQQVVTFKFDPAGQLLWATNFTHAEYDKQPRAIAVDSAGNVCLGIRQEYYCCTDFLLVKYAPDGRELWRAAYDSNEGDADVADTLFGMGLDGAGNIYLAGQVFGHFVEDGVELELGVVKFDGNGNLVWTARHRLHRPTAPVAFTVNSSGASWLAYAASPPQDEPQRSYYASNRFSAVVHFGPDGQERWVSLVTTGDGAALRALAADAAGNIYLTGSAFHEGTSTDLTASRIDPNGNLLWTALYNGPANSGDAGSAIAVGPTGDVFVAGTSFNEVASGVVLLKYQENAVPGLPAIAMPPGNVVTRVGTSVTLTVTATGTAPLRYQWLFNGAPVPGGTSASLTLSRLRENQAGFYAVEVSNPAGTVRSPAARLEILPPPTIQQQPVGQQAVVGGSAYFAVRASGVAPLAYQWLLNGSPIAGATNATLLLENLQATQAGFYSVRISDAAGAIFSQPARLVVSLAATKCEQWDYLTAESNSIGAALIAKDSTGNFYVAGSAWLTNQADFLVLKYSPTGQLLWQASHDFAGETDFATAIAVDAADNVIVAGTSFPPGTGLTGDYATVKFSPQGNKLWARSYSGPVGHDVAQGVAIDQNGNVYVTGWSQWSGELDYRTAYLTVKYSPDGEQLWTAEHRGPASASAYAIAVDAAGDIYVTGSSHDGTGQGDIATIKYNPSGNEVWIARWKQAHGGGSGLTFDGAGDLIVVGYSLPPGRAGIVTIKYDINGNERWSAHFSDRAGSVNVLRTAAVDAAGNIVVAGEIGGDVVTLRYDADGHHLWTAHWGGPRGTEDSVRDLTLDAAGNAYVTGFSRDVERGYPDLVIIKYSPAGTRLWSAFHFEVSGADSILDGEGNVYVALGTVQGVSLLKYCQSDVPGIPEIQQPPQSQHAVVGSSVSFSVIASGTSPLGYQWRHNGHLLPRATNSMLLLSNVQLTDAGNYAVEVFNSLGSVVSADAELTVHVPASIVSPPVDECIIAGSTARFRVAATGESPISYQWSFGDQAIPGATNDTLLVSNVHPSQVGLYTVRVSNPFGSATASVSLTLLPNVEQLWSRTFSSAAPAIGVPDTDDLATVSTLDSAGNLYVAGLSIAPIHINAPQDIFILKYDTNATLQWVAYHRTTNHVTRRPTDIAVNSAGEVHVAVEEFNTNAPALLKYNASGQLLWTARFPGAGDARGRAVAVDPAGNVYLIDTLFQVMKLAVDGTRVWTTTRPDAASAELAVDDAGNIYVTGFAFAPGNGQPTGRGGDYLTVKYNAAGVEQWSRTFRGPVGEDNEAYLIALDNAGNVIVSGFHVVQRLANYGSGFNVGTFKYDPDGNVLWFADYGDTNTMDSPAALKLDAAGNVFLTGFSENFEGRGRRGWTLKYGTGGELQWTREFGSDPDAAETPALAVDAAGNAYASSALRDESIQPIITTVKYSPTGDELWTARFRDSGFSGISYGTFVQGVHADAGGRVLVVGSIGDRMRDVIALAYASSASSDAPVILSQPLDVTVPFRSMAEFSVTAANALRFQWQFNGRDMPGATNATLVVPTADLDDEGRYTVRVENATYCIFSRAAQLTLDVPRPVLINPHVYERYFYCTAVVTPGRSYRLEGSSDLMNWTLVAQQPAYGRTISFNDDASPWQARRFYRVVQEP